MRVLRYFRELADRFRDRAGHETARSDPPDSDGGLRNRMGGALLKALPDPGDVADGAARQLEGAAVRVSAWFSEGGRAAREVTRSASERVRSLWEPEDPVRILEESRLFEPLPDGASEAPPELLSLRWRNEALLALSWAGVVSLEDEITGLTDRLFHTGLPSPRLTKRLLGRDHSEIHRWIDTVPGSGVAGGGVTHRVKHGHDLEAAATIYREHGLEGALVWLQHVGQDVFSSTGIPVPVGGKEVYELLVDQGHTGPRNAALLVSFNAAELSAGFLAGTFAVRLATLLAEMKRRRRVRRRCTAAARAWRRGDLDAAVDNYAEARSLEDDPALSLALGCVYRATKRPAAESFLEFRRAALGLASEDRMIDLDGVAVSLRGLAYLLALVEAPQVLRREDLAGAWREELGRMVRGAVASFEVAAISQSERPGVSVGERCLEWRPRPLSAAANYYLAARSIVAVPFVSASASLDRLRTHALQMLRSAGTEAGEAGRDRLEDVAARWEAALADDQRLLAG